MKALRLFSLIIGLLILTLVVVTAFISPEYSVERKIVIDVKPDRIFPLVGNLKAWEDWSPWMTLDPEMAITYSDQVENSGDFYIWNGEISGEGKLTLLEVTAPNRVVYKMEFKGFEVMQPTGLIQLEAISPNSTEVTWTFGGSVEGEYFMRWFAAFSNDRLGPIFEDGLQRLKQVAESD